MTIQQGLSRSRPALPEAYVLFMVNLHHPYIRVPAGIL